MFYCFFKNSDNGLPYTVLKPIQCWIQCSRCESYQAGHEGYDPRHVPSIIYLVDILPRHVWIWKDTGFDWEDVASFRK